MKQAYTNTNISKMFIDRRQFLSNLVIMRILAGYLESTLWDISLEEKGPQPL